MEYDNDYDNEDDIFNDEDESINNEQLNSQELKKQLDEERQRVAKISEDYKKVEKQRNQYESLMGNLSSELETSGMGKVVMSGDKLRIELNNQSKKENKQMDEMESLKNYESELAQKFDDGEIDQKEYIRQQSEIGAKKILIEMNKKQAKEQEQKQYQSTKEQWISSINKDFPEASNQDSPLFQEMKKIAKSNVDYMNNPDRYYELAERASERLEAKGIKSKKNNSYAEDEYSSLKNESQGYQGTRDQTPSYLSDQDKKYIELTIKQPESIKRIERVLSRNAKSGNIAKDDLYLNRSKIFLES